GLHGHANLGTRLVGQPIEYSLTNFFIRPALHHRRLWLKNSRAGLVAAQADFSIAAARVPTPLLEARARVRDSLQVNPGALGILGRAVNPTIDPTVSTIHSTPAAATLTYAQLKLHRYEYVDQPQGQWHNNQQRQASLKEQVCPRSLEVRRRGRRHFVWLWG